MWAPGPQRSSAHSPARCPGRQPQSDQSFSSSSESSSESLYSTAMRRDRMVATSLPTGSRLASCSCSSCTFFSWIPGYTGHGLEWHPSAYCSNHTERTGKATRRLFSLLTLSEKAWEIWGEKLGKQSFTSKKKGMCKVIRFFTAMRWNVRKSVTISAHTAPWKKTPGRHSLTWQPPGTRGCFKVDLRWPVAPIVDRAPGQPGTQRLGKQSQVPG